MKAIGEEFEYQRVFYKAEKYSDCNKCCFYSENGPCSRPTIEDFKCLGEFRSMSFIIISNLSKGQKNCECAQKDCKNKGANYWHRMNKEYFCETCAEIIAELMAEDIAKMCSDGKLLVKVD